MDLLLPSLRLVTTAGNPAAFFNAELDALKAGNVETQLGREEVVPAAQRTQKRPKVRPASQCTSSRRTALLPLPEDVKVLIISGMQGSGVEGYVKKVTQSLKNCGAAVLRIDTDLFVGTRSDECDICKQCALIRPSIRKVHRCTMCPEALNTDWLNAAINREAADIRHSAVFVQGAQKGIIILEGAYVLAVQDYHDIAGDSRWWFTNLNTARCKKEFLLKQGLWKRPHSTTESAHLAEVEKRENHRLWRMFFHEERWAESMSSFVNVDHVVDLDIDLDPKALSPVETFCSKVRLAARVTLPPLVFSGGTIVADSINVDVVSELSGPLATTPMTRRKQRLRVGGEKSRRRHGFGVICTRCKRHSGSELGFAVNWACACRRIRATLRVTRCTTHTQGSESSGLGATSSPRGAGRGPPAAAASRPSASAGAPHGPAPWQQAGYKHPSRHTVLAPPKGEKFHRSVNDNVRVDPRRNGHKNYLGVYMEKKYTDDLEHAVNKCIRHSEFLTVSPDGWSYLTDVGYIIWKNPGLYYQISRHHKPTEAEMMYAIEVSSSRKDRFQVSALSGDRKEFNLMIRAVQGHSGQLGRVLEDNKAFTKIEEVADLSHYSKICHLDTIIGTNAQGLVPGGVKNAGDRAHVYCIPKPPPTDGTLPNEFCKRGTNCVVELDPVAMKENYALFQTSNGTVLIKKSVEVRDILRVTMLGVTRYTLWTNPTEKKMKDVTQKYCVCQMCGTKYSSGTIWCFDNCWLPLTWLGVHQRITHIVDPAERLGELKTIYGIDHKELQLRQDQPGSAIRSLPRGTFTAACHQHGLRSVELAPVGSEAAAKRQRTATKSTSSAYPPPPKPAMAAPQRVVSASAGQSPRGSAAASSSGGTRASASAVLTARPGAVSASAGPQVNGPSPEARALRASLCENLSDYYMAHLNKGAIKQIKGEGAYRSHTERYRADLGYRAKMIQQGVPEWLVFKKTGHTSRLDGVKEDQWTS